MPLEINCFYELVSFMLTGAVRGKLCFYEVVSFMFIGVLEVSCVSMNFRLNCISSYDLQLLDIISSFSIVGTGQTTQVATIIYNLLIYITLCVCFGFCYTLWTNEKIDSSLTIKLKEIMVRREIGGGRPAWK